VVTLTWLGVFVAALAVLVWSAGVFLRSAEDLGLHFGLSPFIVGVTIVAFGTSFPELVAGVTSVFEGASEIAVATAVGSNVTNILLILGISALLGGGLTVAYELVRVDLPFLFGSALMLFFFAFDGSVDVFEGLIGLATLATYIVYASSSPEEPETAVALAAAEAAPEAPPAVGRLPLRVVLALGASAVLTQLGAHYTIEAVMHLSEELAVGTEVIAATALALGTSLPELVVSVRAARSGMPEMAVGNVIGSNIFNALGVVGVSSLFGSLAVPPALVSFVIPAMLGVTVLCFFVLQEREMTRWDAWLLLSLYLGFLVQVIG